MQRSKRMLIGTAAALTLGIPCAAKTPVFTGKIVAYDPLLHAGKIASNMPNREEVILETPDHKKKYIKLVFVSVGTNQLETKYFDGTTPLSVQALRDHSCDEGTPRFVKQVGLDQRAGTYLLTTPFINAPPGRIKTLECYDATRKK